MANKNWNMQIVTGEYNGSNYQYAPFIRIFEYGLGGNERHVATINLVSAAYVSAPHAGDLSLNQEKIMKARLITAAPEMLALIKENLSFAEYAQAGKEPTPWLVKARALMAKIEGEV